MAYVQLNLPDTLPESVRSAIRVGVEPLFQDVHWMLSTTIGGPSDTEPGRQLQVPIAHTLLAAVAGISTKLYCDAGGDGRTGSRFKNCLTTFFPWDLDPPTGVPKEKAAKILYETFRNPLVHYLGLNPAKSAVKIGQVFRGTDDAEIRVEELERQTSKPYSEPCLVVTTETQVLWLDPLYWGIRILVERLCCDTVEISHANNRLTSSKA